jgi:hypothetical protein
MSYSSHMSINAVSFYMTSHSEHRHAQLQKVDVVENILTPINVFLTYLSTNFSGFMTFFKSLTDIQSVPGGNVKTSSFDSWGNSK